MGIAGVASVETVNRSVARDVLAGLNLEAANRTLAEHWLSLMTDDALPPRAAFHPARFKQFLPNMILLDAVPDRGVTIRLAGTRVTRALGAELTGADWIAMAPPDYRKERLRILSAIARGAVGCGHRRIAMSDGADYVCEEIILPFAGEPSGAHTLLVHVNWKPEYLTEIVSPAQAIGDPIDFRVVALAPGLRTSP